MKPSLGGKFASLLAIFLALQILQLGVGVRQVRHVSEEGEHLGAVGKLRPASLADLARHSLVAGNDRQTLQRQMLDALAAQDRIYRRLHEAYRPKSADPEYADLTRSAVETHDAWEKELRPLIRSLADPARSESAGAALARYETLFPVQAGRLARLAAHIERHLHEEIVVALRNHAVIFALSILFVLGAVWVVRRQIAEPLGGLVKFSQAIAEGTHDRRPTIVSRDEIGQLAHAMREMASTLHMRDVEFAHALEELRESNEMLERIFDTTHTLIAYLDRDFNFIRVNKAYADAGRQAPEFFIGKNHFTLYPGAEAEAAFRRVVETGEPHTVHAHPFEYPDQPERGTTWWDWTVSPVRDAGGQVAALVFALVDVTERVRAEQRAGYLHLHDELTDLPNRTLLLDRLQQALLDAERRGREAAVLCVDLDRFKYVNETLGHAAGDALLKEAAARLGSCVRAGDTVARLAGNEFVVVLADMAKAADAGRIVQKIMACDATAFAYGGRAHFLSASLGVALFPLDGRNAEGLLKNAELAMHQVKERGGNDWRFYSAHMANKAADRVALSNELRPALGRDEFVLHYQPQVDIASGRIVGAEALVRWQHPARGLVPPATFIPLAEESGLIGPLGEWVLRRACEQLRAWDVAGLPPIGVAVNVSAQQFRYGNLAGAVGRALHDCTLPAGRLEIEITESSLMSGDDMPRGMLQRIADMGVRIAIDDFGTGYSALSYLPQLPINNVKIDRAFVHNMAEHGGGALVNAIVAMAHALELKVVAEGVERDHQLARLRAYGCDLAQGFYFSQPLPPDEFARLLREQHAHCRGKDWVS